MSSGGHFLWTEGVFREDFFILIHIDRYKNAHIKFYRSIHVSTSDSARKCSAEHGYRLKYDMVHRWWKHLSLRRNIKYISTSFNNTGLFLTLNAISVLPIFLLNSDILSCSNFNYIRTVQLMKANEIQSA